MGIIRIGVIGYGVRIDMLMDQLSDLCVEARVVAVADCGRFLAESAAGSKQRRQTG